MQLIELKYAFVNNAVGTFVELLDVTFLHSCNWCFYCPFSLLVDDDPSRV